MSVQDLETKANNWNFKIHAAAAVHTSAGGKTYANTQVNASSKMVRLILREGWEEEWKMRNDASAAFRVKFVSMLHFPMTRHQSCIKTSGEFFLTSTMRCSSRSRTKSITFQKVNVLVLRASISWSLVIGHWKASKIVTIQLFQYCVGAISLKTSRRQYFTQLGWQAIRSNESRTNYFAYEEERLIEGDII